MIGASASMASAADETPQIVIDCVQGYEAVYSDDGSSGTCEPIAVTFDETTTDGTCWTNEDGVNACARGGVLGTTEDPVPASGCTTTTDADGNEATLCMDQIAYTTLPADNTGDGTPVDCSSTDVPCDVVMPMDADETLMFKNAAGLGGSSSTDSNTLALLGVLVAALGALGIGLSNQKTLKK
jgi:hypothetical protein